MGIPPSTLQKDWDLRHAIEVWEFGAPYFACPWMVVVMTMGFSREEECGDEVLHRIYEHECLHTLCQIHLHSILAMQLCLFLSFSSVK